MIKSPSRTLLQKLHQGKIKRPPFCMPIALKEQFLCTHRMGNKFSGMYEGRSPFI